jgi:30S ribosomal protein S31
MGDLQPTSSFLMEVDRPMGKGDRRTRRGKIWRGTYGNTRPKKKKKASQKTAKKS